MKIQGKTYDEERALYGVSNLEISECIFDGPEDGESALKEASDIVVSDCNFRLRYPLWHVHDAQIENCQMTETCRAALWYDRNLTIRNSKLEGIKALRECTDITIAKCRCISSEFGWMCQSLRMSDCALMSEYPFLGSNDIEINDLDMKAKYSFQYTRNVIIRNSKLDTKDAFWHSKNVIVYDSVVKGEYLGWYAENLKLVRCTIIGTQPLCYAKGVVLEDCTMKGCDLSFERSEVEVEVRGRIDSVKNPISGIIKADSIGETILEPEFVASNATIVIGDQA